MGISTSIPTNSNSFSSSATTLSTPNHRSLRCALKVDRPNGRQDLLKWESDILLKLQKYPFFARHYGFYDTPKNSLTNKVLVMSLLGSNISAIRRTHPGSQLPYGICINMAIQMIMAVEAVHQEGYIHRDLKPSNFVIGIDKIGKRQLFLLDFGQSRQYIEPSNGTIRPARETADFRGTSLYSSYNAHLLRDLGRRDDLWSLFYVLIDMCRGGLPWRIWKDDRKRCEVLKQYYYNHPKELVQDLPGEEYLLQIQEHLLTLSFSDRPDYALIITLLRKTLQYAIQKNVHKNRPRPPYTDTDELKNCIELLNNPNFNINNKTNENEIEEGEIGEDGIAIVNKQAKLFTPLPSSTPSVILSPPPFTNPDGTKNITGEPSTTMASTNSSSTSSTSVTVEYDIEHSHYTVDNMLYSRGGRWSSYSLEGLRLDNILTYDIHGSVSNNAHDLQNKLEAIKQDYKELLSGWEHEVIDDDSINNVIVPSNTSHTIPLPVWLRNRRRFPVFDRIPDDIDTDSIDDMVNYLRKKLRELPNALFWGAGMVLTKTSPSDTSSSLTPALGAAIEFSSAWSSIVTMVMNTNAIKNLNKLDTIPDYIQKIIQQLYTVIYNTNDIHIPAISDNNEVSKKIITAANDGLELIKNSSHANFLLPLASSPISLTYSLSPFIRHCMDTLGNEVINNITLRVQKSISIIELWLSINSHKLPPATGVSSIMEQTNPVNDNLNDDDNEENNENIANEEKQQRNEIRKKLKRVQQYLQCLQRERDMLRVITVNDISSSTSTSNISTINRTSSSSSTTAINNSTVPVPIINGLSSISSRGNTTNTDMNPSVHNLLSQAISSSTNITDPSVATQPSSRKRNRWGNADSEPITNNTTTLSASNPVTQDDDGENMEIE